VLVTFAVEAEFAPWRKLRQFREAVLSPKHWSGGARVRETTIGEHTAWVYLTGMGIKCFDFRCVSCTKSAGADAVISSGLAGALKSAIPPGAVVVPRRVGTLRDSTGLAAPMGLLNLAVQQGAMEVGALLTSDRIIDSLEEKRRLSQFADVVDMESFHVVRAFADDHLPVSTIRSISDCSDEELPVDFEKCLTPTGAVKVVPLLRELASRPSKVPALVRFGRQSRAAAERLIEFLDTYIQALTPEVLNEVAEATNE
jgi:nucleoside phosphorylase